MTDPNNVILEDRPSSLRNKCEKGVFRHYISLGDSCYVAEDLEKMGLRDASMPFDWTRTEWGAVIRSFDTHFEGYLNYDDLYQKIGYPNVYINKAYGVGFVHDFVKYRSLKSQINGVKKKYKRRIDRFFDFITEPTLFIRYCLVEDEVTEISRNYDKIKKMIQRYNKENEIVVITHEQVEIEKIKNIEYFYSIGITEGDELNRCPIQSAQGLFEILNNAVYDKKEANLQFEENKKNSTPSIYKSIKKKINKRRMKKEYIHDKQVKY